MIPFFKKTAVAESEDVICGSTGYRERVSEFFTNHFPYPNFFLTKSCSQALELAVMSLGFPKGSEVIVPSYGFVALANAVALSGLRCVFVDCDPRTMNVSTEAVLDAITDKTVAVITINYGGVACDYDELLPICSARKIVLIEDNAHGIRAKYKNRYLGSFGDISTISFDFLKNVTCDEGGGVCVNNSSLLGNFEMSYNFGTNKADFYKGTADFYEWKTLGTNSLLAEPLAEILHGQLLRSEDIIGRFRAKWKIYYDALSDLVAQERIELAVVPDYSEHNGHMFWIKTKDEAERSRLISFLQAHGISSAFHYSPLHLSEFGKKAGEFRGTDIYTTKESGRLLRLPQYYSLTESEQAEVIGRVHQFYGRQS